MNKIVSIVVILVLLVGGAYLLTRNSGERAPQEFIETESMDITSDGIVILHTNMGDITIQLFIEDAPITTGNFLALAQDGFYDGVKFHRVINGFMIQVGDPLTKDDTLALQWGTGGPGYTIEDEFVEGLSNVRGTLSMANVGAPNSGGSQFFINLTDNIALDFDKEPLTSKHPVFGRVIEGMDVVDAIAAVSVDSSARPLESVTIESVTIN